MAFFSFLVGILRYSFRVNEYPTTTTTTKKKQVFQAKRLRRMQPLTVAAPDAPGWEKSLFARRFGAEVQSA